MDSKSFWALVDQKKIQLIAEHRERVAAFQRTNRPTSWEGQPSDGASVFLMSLDDPLEKNVFGGSVACAPMRLAAQLIVEKRHRVATAEEIEKFISDRKQQYNDEREKEREMASLRAGTARPGPAPQIHVHVDREGNSRVSQASQEMPKVDHGNGRSKPVNPPIAQPGTQTE